MDDEVSILVVDSKQTYPNTIQKLAGDSSNQNIFRHDSVLKVTLLEQKFPISFE